jgi:acetoin utilization deacetylase AcuC-like enzyme
VDTQALVTLADRRAKGRIVSVLEGCYQLSALVRSVVAQLRVASRGVVYES